MAGGKARNISSRNQPDPRFNQYQDEMISMVAQNAVSNTLMNKQNTTQYLKNRDGMILGMIGQRRQSITISSGVLDITQDASGDSVTKRGLIVVDPESAASTDILDGIEMNGTEIEGARLTLMGIVTKEVVITHLATPAGTEKNITCPGNIDYILDGEDVVDLIYDKTSETWVIVNSTTYGTIEVRTKESTEADVRLYRDDGTPNDNNILGNFIFSGNDSAGNKTDYAEISGVSEDVTNGTEDGTMRLRVLEGGSMVTPFEIDGSAKEFNIRDTYNFVFSTSTGTQIGTASGQKIGFWGVTPVVQRSAYTVTNHVTDRSYDANATTVAELADVLGTLIVDLRSVGIVQ